MAVEHRPEVPAPLFDLIQFFFIGIILSLVLYGLAISILISIFRTFYRKSVQARRQAGQYRIGRTYGTWLPVVYAALLFSFGTSFLLTDTILLVRAVLYNPLFPNGGAFMFVLRNYNAPYVVLCNTSFEITIWLADAFMLYRCLVIYSGLRWVVILPGLMYLASVVSGIFLLIQSSEPDSSLYSNVNFGLVNFSIAAGLNVLIAAMISARLIFHRQRVRKALGLSPGYLQVYTSITTIVVESSGLYALFSILFIVPFAKEHPVAQVFLPMLGQIQVISPLLVVLRLAKQRAWTATTTVDVSTGRNFKFGQPKTQPSTQNQGEHSQTVISLQERKKRSEADGGWSGDGDHESESVNATESKIAFAA